MNGVFSVLGSILALVCALNLGFKATLVFAAGCYVVALLVAFRLPSEVAGSSDPMTG